MLPAPCLPPTKKARRRGGHRASNGLFEKALVLLARREARSVIRHDSEIQTGRGMKIDWSHQHGTPQWQSDPAKRGRVSPTCPVREPTRTEVRANFPKMLPRRTIASRRPQDCERFHEAKCGPCCNLSLWQPMAAGRRRTPYAWQPMRSLRQFGEPFALVWRRTEQFSKSPVSGF